MEGLHPKDHEHRGGGRRRAEGGGWRVDEVGERVWRGEKVEEVGCRR
jgi:hypothetical protein